MSQFMPNSLDAERALLGAIFLRPSKAAEALAFVAPEDFWNKGHQFTFSAMVELDRRGKTIEPLTVSEYLKSRDQTVEGGMQYLAETVNAVTTSENLEQYARIIAQKARQRDLIRLCNETSAKARGECDTDELLADVERAVFALGRSSQQEHTVTLKAVIGEGIKRLEQRKKSGPTGIPTGFPDLDALWGGLNPDDLIVLAARPRMGKSALAVGLLMNAAKNGFPGLMYSLEMGNQQLGDRVLSCGAKVALSRIRSGKVEAHDWRNLTLGMSKILNLPIEFDFSGELTVQAIRARTRRWASRVKKAGVVVVDYLQLLKLGGRKRDSRELEVNEITQQLKALAKEIHVPIVALCQVSRKCEEQKDKRPTLANLRESGAIEAHADLVAALFREEVYDEDTSAKGVAELITLKHRQGPEGTVELKWLGDFTLFEGLEPHRDHDDWKPHGANGRAHYTEDA
jgi:replicative DNA helicase